MFSNYGLLPIIYHKTFLPSSEVLTCTDIVNVHTHPANLPLKKTELACKASYLSA